MTPVTPLPPPDDLRLGPKPEAPSDRPPVPSNEPAGEVVVPEPAHGLGESPAVDLWADPVPTFTYLAGAAGSGKTFATRDWANREPAGKLAIVATTGIAAINVGGTTINSLLGYFDTKNLQESYTNGHLSAKLGKLWRNGVRRIILDEVSMLDGDQLTYLVRGVEELNGRGYVIGKTTDDFVDRDQDEITKWGMGLTLVGDFAQLKPVQGLYAFESPEWERFRPHTITLTEIRRQADPQFITALRAARVGDGKTALEFFAAKLQRDTDDRFEGPTIYATNQAVDRYNWLRLDRVQGRSCMFTSERWGEQRSEWGDPKKSPNTWNIPIRLNLKIGALVMVLANRRAMGSSSFVYVNGDLGELVDADEGKNLAFVKLQRTGHTVAVDYVRRDKLIPCSAARREELREQGKEEYITEDGRWEIVGWVKYMPLRIAYASTVHKSQGLTLDHVQVNIRDAFFKEPGMIYVALSRARTAEGLRIVGDPATLIDRCSADPRLKEWL